jgi:hypothetical protein
MMPKTSAGLLLVAWVCVCGCGVDLDLDFDFDATCERDCLEINDDLEFGDSIHRPYTVGTIVKFTAERRNYTGGWSMAIDDQSVVKTEDYSGGPSIKYLTCSAVGEGETQLKIYNADGSIRSSRTLSVEAPDRLRVYAAPPGGNSSQWLIESRIRELDDMLPVPVVVGETATFAIRYYKGEKELFGSGALQVEHSGHSLDLKIQRSYKTMTSEWLRVTPLETGYSRIYLEVAGRSLSSLLIQAIEDNAIDSVLIVAKIVPELASFDSCLLARAFDRSGLRIHTGKFSWSVDDVLQDEIGDLFCYREREAVDPELKVSAGSASTQREFEASEWYVTSSETLKYYDGCGTAPVGSFFLSLFPFLGMLCFQILRIRRR